MSKLKPCPFCGNKAEVYEECELIKIRCSNYMCQASVNSWHDEVEDAIDAWNKRNADRPQGEWIRTGRTNIYGGIEVQCSNCGDRVMVQHLEDEWYCRHCGADMGMKGADDYKRSIEQMEHDMLYEPTYNPEDGSM